MIISLQDWDKTSTPLAAKGKEPKYVKPADKVSATEGDNAYFFLDILGDPVPQVTWFKVSGPVDIVDIKLQPPVCRSSPRTCPRSQDARAGPTRPARSSSGSPR